MRLPRCIFYQEIAHRWRWVRRTCLWLIETLT